VPPLYQYLNQGLDDVEQDASIDAMLRVMMAGG
jgi:hypothetical protein